MAAEKTQKSKTTVASVIAIPGYKIIDILGRGGMAIVYKAVQESVDRTVAIKILAPNHSDETFTDRFLREAQIISNLNHPNIITVFDAGVHNSHHYMSMEYISGKTLRDARDDLSRTQKMDILKQIASALDFAGKKGYVHRDIKPENIMLHEDGRAVLMDFGIARGNETARGLTLTGKAIGTPYYMSPEQTKGINVDPRSDIYSLGVVIFQALTGHVPYDGTSFVDVGMKHITEPIPVLPKGLELFQPIINKSMSKDPNHRYQSASELLDALNTVSFSELDILDAKSNVIHSKQVDDSAPTMIESDLNHSVKVSTNTKLKAIHNIKSGAKIKNAARHKRATNPEINFTQTDEFKSLKRRRRFIYLILVASLVTAAYFNKKTIEPYWQEYALPLLNEHLSTELKEIISLQTLEKKSDLSNNVNDIKKLQVVKKVISPNVLFQIEDFLIIEQDFIENKSIKIINDAELVILKENLNQQPQNANHLILHYKALLKSDNNDSNAVKGVADLHKWFITQLDESLANNDFSRGKLLQNILKIHFLNIQHNEKYQKIKVSFLQQESIKTHLRLAEEFFIKKHYIEPESENTLEELMAVFAIDSNNVGAKTLQRKMVDIFVEQVKSQQATKHFESAIISAESGLKISKNDAFLKASYLNLKKLLNVQQDVNNYLKLAKIQMDKGNYVTPQNNNAFKIYNSIFELDKNNKDSLAALKLIESKLVGQATQAIKSHNILNAKMILELLEHYYPDSPYLKKTQTSLAEAISSKDPAITKIIFSDVLMNSIEKMEDIRIQSGKVIYFGFKFKNFSRKTTYILVKLLDHSAVTKIITKTIKVDGTRGEQIFSVEIPGTGLTPGNYYIELKHGKKSLIKKAFQIFKP